MGLASVEAGGESYVFTLARPGECYICYVLGEGPVTIGLRVTEGDFSARWYYDPKRGQFVRPAERIEGGERHRFRSPAFRQDVVLYVRRSGS